MSCCLFQLLQKNPEVRLGAGEEDAGQIKAHRFFQVRRVPAAPPSWPQASELHLVTVSPQGTDWDGLLAKRVKPPFLPVIRSPRDVSNFDQEFTRLQPVLTLPRTACVLSQQQQQIFADFDFSLLS